MNREVCEHGVWVKDRCPECEIESLILRNKSLIDERDELEARHEEAVAALNSQGTLRERLVCAALSNPTICNDNKHGDGDPSNAIRWADAVLKILEEEDERNN